jgi:hypothetical protein
MLSQAAQTVNIGGKQKRVQWGERLTTQWGERLTTHALNGNHYAAEMTVERFTAH